jgi:hypothetical protein
VIVVLPHPPTVAGGRSGVSPCRASAVNGWGLSAQVPG